MGDHFGSWYSELDFKGGKDRGKSFPVTGNSFALRADSGR